jgi:hypothetical protein
VLSTPSSASRRRFRQSASLPENRGLHHGLLGAEVNVIDGEYRSTPLEKRLYFF